MESNFKLCDQVRRAACGMHKLNLEITCYSKLCETTKRYEAEGVEADPRTPDEVRKMLPIEMAK